jgi:hypothetical protein
MRMNASIFLRLRLLGAVSILVFAASAATAQNGPDSPAPPSSATKPGNAPDAKPPKKSTQKSGDKSDAAKIGDKSDSDSKKTNAPPNAPSGYATEAEARAHCRTTVVWVDSSHFNHYRGSCEYGRKPGSFGCE